MTWLYDLFVLPIEIRGVGRLLMLAPLILSVSLVYKTIRCPELKQIPFASIKLCIMILSGMLAIGVSLLVTFRLLA
ncbi:MAG: hypothetical protein H6819_07265 [Phycisphaerales bacterium]|nr:hypothetical protein [Phycisphaerales bacterium]MCB9857706.1 hypothetical protein [Phycisphaerales bacterium]MCB9864795.1 hypothetical protein [Phycisphaerales bacterium]